MYKYYVKTEIPQWLSDEHLPKEVLAKRDEDWSEVWTKNVEKGEIRANNLQGTFTDGYALYRTLSQVENVNWIRFACNINKNELQSYLNEMFTINTEAKTNGNPLTIADDFIIYYSGLAKEFNGDWVGYDIATQELQYISLRMLSQKWVDFKQRLKAYDASVNTNADNVSSTVTSNVHDKWFLIVSDTNYSGIWATKAVDQKLFQQHQLLIQSSVDQLGVCVFFY
ncbi:hypothetical protein RFI_13567 [Reticulomyxa filosa]|uniref:Uncharacterized protein n=1 Tax=Reticulomyxa filosa TaxID=46433 RepID=X6NCW7_RETFI|nr:hypothetical protein RFI_13567 [Reticulomyxa filosa]|eukprot:ETO23614.1 hypothetical protein RFI_13567 [Reticulomyxa filosa]